MYSDMNDKKSYTVEDVQRICVDRFKRLDGIRQWKVQFDSSWNKKGGGGVGTQREQRGIILSFKNVKGGP